MLLFEYENCIPLYSSISLARKIIAEPVSRPHQYFALHETETCRMVPHNKQDVRSTVWYKQRTVAFVLVVAARYRRHTSCIYLLLVLGVKQIRSPKIDPGKLDRKLLRELLDRSDSFDWDKGSDASGWSGVSLDSEDRILGLNVAHRHLTGELPAALGDISNLEYLHATSNVFIGDTKEVVKQIFHAVFVYACDLPLFRLGHINSLVF